MVDTLKSAADYATALQHLLPPGQYFKGESVDKITLAEGEELARIDAKIDADFDITNAYFGFNVDQENLGWTLADFEAMLTSGGMSNFLISDHYHLPLVAGSRCGTSLGTTDNVSLIRIHYQDSQQVLFDSLTPLLINHKLAHTRIEAIALPSETSNIFV